MQQWNVKTQAKSLQVIVIALNCMNREFFLNFWNMALHGIGVNMLAFISCTAEKRFLR